MYKHTFSGGHLMDIGQPAYVKIGLIVVVTLLALGLCLGVFVGLPVWLGL